MSVTVIHADSRDALREMADESVDSCVCDPPYALVSIVKRFGGAGAAPAKDRDGLYKRASAGFMGKTWDTGDTAFDPAFWAEVLRVLKPGAHLVAFGGTRTYHRLVCAIEDSGFEIRDQLAWLFGSGFPKSHDVAVAIDKAAKGVPHGGRNTDSPNAGKFKTQATEGKRSDGDTGQHFGAGPGQFMLAQASKYERDLSPEAAAWQGWGTALKPAHEPICLARKSLIGTVAANVLQHGTGALNIDASRVGVDGGCAGAGKGEGARVFGDGLNGKRGEPVQGLGRWPANVIHDSSEEVLRHFPESDSVGGDGYKTSMFCGGKATGGHGLGDSGNAARFFYSAKADDDDRLGSKHPTVKPVDLMAYLIKLVTPPGGVVLDPFAGSGTTGMACMREGYKAILIEREAEYVADIKRRLAHVRGDDTPLFSSA